MKNRGSYFLSAPPPSPPLTTLQLPRPKCSPTIKRRGQKRGLLLPKSHPIHASISALYTPLPTCFSMTVVISGFL